MADDFLTIITPKNESTDPLPEGWGHHEAIGKRPYLEDTAALSALTLPDVSPEQIGHRLWTIYRIIDQFTLTKKISSGCTACTTVYDGKGHLITATLGDSVSFAVVYGENGRAVSVTRLNSVLHHPTHTSEKHRIVQAGGTITINGRTSRVNETIAVSRSIGDHCPQLQSPIDQSNLICAEATIDCVDVSELEGYTPTRKVQVITACDGFTEPSKSTRKDRQERYLLDKLGETIIPGELEEPELAKALVQAALQDKSSDNVSVAVHTIVPKKAALLGIYDGHGGPKAAIVTAKNIVTQFNNLCQMTEEVYQNQEFCVSKFQHIYDRDNVWIHQLGFFELYEAKLLSEQNINNVNEDNYWAIKLFANQKQLTQENLDALEKIKQPLAALTALNDCPGVYLLNMDNLQLLIQQSDPNGTTELLKLLKDTDMRNHQVIQKILQTKHLQQLLSAFKELNRFQFLTPRNIYLVSQLDRLDGFTLTPTTQNKSQLLQLKTAEETHLLHNKTIASNSTYHRDSEKVAILAKFKKALAQATTEEELGNAVIELKASNDYRKLIAGRGFITKTFNLQTPSAQTFEQMIKEQRQIIRDSTPSSGLSRK